MTTTHNTPDKTVAEQAEADARAKTIRDAEQATKDTAHDAKVAAARAKETPEQRTKREAAETAAKAAEALIGDVDQCRIELQRAEDVYQVSIKGAVRKLQAIVSADVRSDAAKAARAVADEYELDVHPKAQPPAPKSATPAKK